MQFSTVAIIAAAGAMASLPYGSAPVGTGKAAQVTSTVFRTEYHTITDCAEYVTDCPSHATKVVTNIVAVSTTICDAEEYKPSAPPAGPTAPAGPYAPVAPSVPPYPTGTTPAGKPEKPAKGTGLPKAPAGPVGTGVVHNAAVPGTTLPAAPVDEECVTARVKLITTMVPSVITVTEEVPCETAPPSKPVAPSGGAPSGTGVITPPSGVPVTAGAMSLAGSAAMAVAGAVAAFALA
ncbi:GPI anchored serine-rich protein [Ceratocystis lukuohia]|uniref:GPI anchored serine-rich protein n=1 Tax=Ceratocystis lukuohia TaxID=2019550 RepID=A0ABR4MDU2_9PEZI